MIDTRQKDLGARVYSQKSHTENSSSGLGIRNSAKATAPKCEMQATSYAYHYFLNGHGDVTYFSDQNFTEEQIETYEYTPWGVLLTSARKNNLLYTAREFDFETELIYDKWQYYSAFLDIYIHKEFKNFIKSIESLYYHQNENKNIKLLDIVEIQEYLSEKAFSGESCVKIKCKYVEFWWYLGEGHWLVCDGQICLYECWNCTFWRLLCGRPIYRGGIEIYEDTCAIVSGEA